ncbi:arylsulfatase B-like [Ptychodera flava]|uniref:arylsulfatase B-like n=1 Tax=Ptychodera flava TaxID=63121 RepID=UPI003969F793
MFIDKMFNKVALCIVLLLYSWPVESKTERPHILFILADDLGWNDIGYNNPCVITPTLDALAQDGVIFNQSYALPTCTPSRASFMTGYFAYRTGLQHKVLVSSRPTGLPLHFTTLPQKLKEQGYSTYMVGKYFPKKFPIVFLRILTQQYLFREKAANYVANHDKDKPMFMYFSLQSVHGPQQVPNKYRHKYLSVKNLGRRTKLGMITAMDDSVAVLVEAFKEHGLWKNTLLIFQSDNGGPAGDKNFGNNWPLRGSKGTLWEGGTRVVTFAHGPMLKKTGYVSNEMVHIVDWFPTLVTLTGGESDSEMDGLNLWDTISKGAPTLREEFVYNIDEDGDIPKEAIRIGNYKLIHGKAGVPDGWIAPPESCCHHDKPNGDDIHGEYIRLYNLKDDPTERNDLSEAMSYRVERMLERLKELKEKTHPVLSPPRMIKESSPSRFGGAYSPGWC